MLVRDSGWRDVNVSEQFLKLDQFSESCPDKVRLQINICLPELVSFKVGSRLQDNGVLYSKTVTSRWPLQSDVWLSCHNAPNETFQDLRQRHESFQCVAWKLQPNQSQISRGRFILWMDLKEGPALLSTPANELEARRRCLTGWKSSYMFERM